MRLCSGAGCLRAIPEGQRYCDECKPAPTPKHPGREHMRTDGYNEELDALRKGTRWQKTRALKAKQQPICALCGRARTKIVDHIVPAEIAIRQVQASGRFPLDKWAGYYLMSNLQGLCRPCHQVKTDEDKRHAGEWPDVMEAYDRAPKKRWTF